MINLTKETVITRVSDGAAAAQTAVESAVVDMKNFDGVTFIATLGDVTATCVLTLTLQHGDESDGSDMASTGITAGFTAAAADADEKLLIAEIARPLKRYCRAVLTRGTANAVVDSVLCVQTSPSSAPTTQSADVLATAFDLGPATA